MKISCLLLSLAAAGKKRGNAELGYERLIWKTPLCLTRPAQCSNSQVFNAPSGELTFGPEDYKNSQSSIFTIKAGSNRKVIIQFDTDYGFEMEYHNQCGYDKLHIYTGEPDDFTSARRLARFCGPKQSNWKKPFDGARKLRNLGGVLPMWDEPLDTLNSNVMIAVDTDQDVSGLRGFRIKWTSELVRRIVFTQFDDALDFTHHFITTALRSSNSLKAANVLKAFNSFFETVRSRATDDNGTKCLANQFDVPIPASHKEDFNNYQETMAPDVKHVLRVFHTFIDLIKFHIGPACKNFDNWDSKKRNLSNKLKSL